MFCLTKLVTVLLTLIHQLLVLKIWVNSFWQNLFSIRVVFLLTHFGWANRLGICLELLEWLNWVPENRVKVILFLTVLTFFVGGFFGDEMELKLHHVFSLIIKIELEAGCAFRWYISIFRKVLRHVRPHLLWRITYAERLVCLKRLLNRQAFWDLFLWLVETVGHVHLRQLLISGHYLRVRVGQLKIL